MINTLEQLKTSEQWRRTDLTAFNFERAEGAVTVETDADRVEQAAREPQDIFTALNRQHAVSTVELRALGASRTAVLARSKQPGTFYTRVLMRAEGEAVLIEEAERSNGAINAYSEITVSVGSRLEYLVILNYERASSFSLRRVILEQNASVSLNFLVLGGGSGKERFEVELAGANASAQINGLYLSADKSNFNIDTLQRHLASATESDLLVHGVNTGNGKVTVEGLITLGSEAQQARASLANHHRLAGVGAKAQSIPRLEIDANDVVCTHAVTVGGFDPEQVFYLKSRGLSDESVRQILTDGFIKRVLDRMPASHRSRIEAQIARRR